MSDFTLSVDNQGRVMLPSKWRKENGVGPNSQLFAVVRSDGVLVIETREQGLKRARSLVRKYVPARVALSEELIADRRAEAEKERNA